MNHGMTCCIGEHVPCGTVFGKYVRLKGRTSLRTRYMHHLLLPIFHLKGITSLRMRYMRHLPLPIWEEIIHFPCKVDPLPLFKKEVRTRNKVRTLDRKIPILERKKRSNFSIIEAMVETLPHRLLGCLFCRLE